ncbi:hypothetical protein ACU5B6_20175 [Moritella viscosa]|uniref:hypothetical protein n=1 Tax=Moritella viscosa TaxID=80854 RepID=UPI0009139ED3|nr:hypothetical protein [Moritella viscosa]SHO08907.1 Putative uncharacterized protein [Moritella viscosa]
MSLVKLYDFCGNKFISISILLIHIFTFTSIYHHDSALLKDFLIVWICGMLLSSIELGSRYKDNPISVLKSPPGLLYMSLNGLICCFGFFCILTFGLHLEVDDSLPLLAQRTMDIIQAAAGSMFIMRSSFLKLGHESQTDLGLNIVIKKLLDMVDREVDRVRAIKRSKDVTTILENVSYKNTRNKVISYCLDVMQNVSPEERRRLKFDLNAIDAQDESFDRDILKFSSGLLIYNIVGKSVLESAVKDLNLASNEKEENTPLDTDEGFDGLRDTYDDIMSSISPESQYDCDVPQQPNEVSKKDNADK